MLSCIALFVSHWNEYVNVSFGGIRYVYINYSWWRFCLGGQVELCGRFQYLFLCAFVVWLLIFIYLFITV